MIPLSISLSTLLSLEQPLVHPHFCMILGNIDVDVDEPNVDEHYAPTSILLNLTNFILPISTLNSIHEN